MGKKAEVRARGKEHEAAKAKARAVSHVPDEADRTNGRSRIGSNKDGGTTILGEARPGTSRQLANDQPCIGIHGSLNRFPHTIAVHILSVLLVLIFPVILMILRVTVLIQVTPTLLNPRCVFAFILVLGSGLFPELARIAPVRVVINRPAKLFVRILLGVRGIQVTALYRTTCRLMTRV